MAPKQAEKIPNPPAASSSEEEEEEEEESGSSGEESGSSSDEPNDIKSKLTQKPPPPPAPKKPESDSEESESESDSDSDPPTKTKPLNTVVSKPTSGSALPESSTTKRSLKEPDEPKNKKVKTSTTTEHSKNKKKDEEVVKKISGEEAKKMFQRLFSETDEIAMLQGFLDFTSDRGDPYENMDAFCDYVKRLIDFNASKAQIVTKLQRCKKKFVNIVKNAVKRGKSEDMVTCSKDLDQKAFELSRKIWGANGVLPAKPRKMAKEDVKSPPSPLQTPKKEVVKGKQRGNVVLDAQISSNREMAMFFKAENVSVFGLDESTVSRVWDMVEDGPKKREMEEKLKKLKDMQVELCLQRTALLDTTAKMIFKGNASSSSS